LLPASVTLREAGILLLALAMVVKNLNLIISIYLIVYQ